MSVREIKESPMEQGTDEKFAYRFDTTLAQNGGTVTPSACTIAVYDITDGAYTDVTSTVMPVNSPTISTVYITTSPFFNLTVDKTYRMEYLFTISGNIYERYIVFYCTR